MIKTMTQKVLHNWGDVFETAIFWQYYQEPYLEPNQKSMVELFSKNSLPLNEL